MMNYEAGKLFYPHPRTNYSRSLYGESLRYFPLSQQQAVEVIRAVGVAPIRHSHLKEDGMTPGRKMTIDEAIQWHSFAVHQLIGKLEDLGIHPAEHKEPSSGYRRTALSAVRRLLKVLDQPETAALYGYREDERPQLKAACVGFQGLLEINERCSLKPGAERQILRRLGGSKLELFVRNELARVYKDIFGREPGTAKPESKKGRASGPFIRFAAAFFTAIGLTIKPGTVHRALYPRSSS